MTRAPRDAGLLPRSLAAGKDVAVAVAEGDSSGEAVVNELLDRV